MENLDDFVEPHNPKPPEPKKIGIAKDFNPTEYYILSADLASISDFTAIIINQVFRHKKQQKIRAFQTRHIERPPIATSYPQIIKLIETLLRTPPLYGSCYCVVEDNGPGRVVSDTIRDHGFNVISVFTSGGEQVSYREDLNRYTVPKLHLVGALNMMLQTHRLEIADSLPLAKILKDELHNFRLKVKQGGRITFENAADALHDDTVIAEAINCWFGNQTRWLPDEEPEDIMQWAD